MQTASLHGLSVNRQSGTKRHASGIVLAHLFQPDVMTPEQWERLIGARSAFQPPYIALARALLAANVAVLSRGPDGLKDRKGREGSFADDYDWLLREDDTYPLTFRNCCEILGLDADYLRAGIVRALDLDGLQGQVLLRPIRHLRVGRPLTARANRKGP